MKNFIFNNKIFVALCIFLGLLSMTFILMQIFMWEEYLLPHYPDATLNNISGLNFLAYFTILSNLFAGLWLLLYAISRLFSPKLLEKVTNKTLQGAITTYVALTGFVYWGLLVWFIDFYPKELWMFNVIDVYNHLIMPLFMVILWLFPLNNREVRFKSTYIYMIFPLTYFVVSMIRGYYIKWYAYPFLNASELWTTLFEGDYNAVIANILMIVCIVLFIGLFFGMGCLLNKVHNIRIKSLY